MMQADPQRDPSAFAREHHLHYDVETEVAEAAERQPAAFDVRLFASHEGRRLTAPACPECTDLLAELRAFADGIVGDEREPPVEVVAQPAVLYRATDDASKDEVSVTIRVGPLATGAEDGERALARIRARLEAAGVAQH